MYVLYAAERLGYFDELTLGGELLNLGDRLRELVAGAGGLAGLQAELLQDVLAAGTAGDGLSSLDAGGLGVGAAKAGKSQDLLAAGKEL